MSSFIIKFKPRILLCLKVFGFDALYVYVVFCRGTSLKPHITYSKNFENNIANTYTIRMCIQLIHFYLIYIYYVFKCHIVYY